jgi:PBP1b-binding outer membrane lipoprotein LpoB
MNRLITTCALALFLVGCTAKSEGTTPAGNMPAAAATDTSAKFELGKAV